MSKTKAAELKAEIFKKVTEYFEAIHRVEREAVFEPGVSKVHYAGRVFDDRDMINLVDSAMDFWLTAGPYARELEKSMREFFGARGFYLVNSGSSANLVMVSTLRAASYKGHLKLGDEVITPAVTFPTTLTPILQNQLVPVFVDAEVGTYNIDPARIEEAIGPKTRAILIPHTLGNPCKMDTIMEIAARKGLVVLEDCCDALGSRFDGKMVGTFGAMASLSFYPAHHMTMGEGGGVVVNNPEFDKIVLSVRDWGRDCWCEPGHSGTCGERFTGTFGKLPKGYDHKYVYSNHGYNLKVTDMQAAVGLSQFDKLAGFIEARKKNFKYYYTELRALEDYLVLPRWEEKADPSWFAFPVTVKQGVDFNSLIQYLEDAKIETRKVFAGNILRQPGFTSIEHRLGGSLENTDTIMDRTFFIGVYPGLTQPMMEFVADTFKGFFRG